jgi:surfeit locus 1 family protein
VGQLLILVVAVGFINLGLWQLRRLHQRLERNATIEQRMNRAPEPLDALLARTTVDAPLGSPDALAYRHARVRGRYDPGHEVLLRSRSLDGNPGYDVLTPLVLGDGRALLVDRGWVPYEDSTPPVAAAAPPQGTVTLTGLMRAPERAPSGGLSALAPHDPPKGPRTTPFYTDPQRLQAQMPYPLVDATLDLQTQQPANPGELPRPLEPPALDNGPHLSYAIQWFSFTAIAVVGYVFLMLRMARDTAEEGRGSAEESGGPRGAGAA